MGNFKSFKVDELKTQLIESGVGSNTLSRGLSFVPKEPMVGTEKDLVENAELMQVLLQPSLLGYAKTLNSRKGITKRQLIVDKWNTLIHERLDDVVTFESVDVRGAAEKLLEDIFPTGVMFEMNGTSLEISRNAWFAILAMAQYSKRLRIVGLLEHEVYEDLVTSDYLLAELNDMLIHGDVRWPLPFSVSVMNPAEDINLDAGVAELADMELLSEKDGGLLPTPDLQGLIGALSYADSMVSVKTVYYENGHMTESSLVFYKSERHVLMAQYDASGCLVTTVDRALAEQVVSAMLEAVEQPPLDQLEIQVDVGEAVDVAVSDSQPDEVAAMEPVDAGSDRQVGFNGFCTNCGAKLKEGSKFCTDCGQPVKVKPSTKFCTNCGKENPADNKFCTACGQTL